MESLRVLELYSGIGGMHFALKESGVQAHVVAAVDINPTANQIYRHNFPDTPLWNKTIEGISLDDFNKLSFDMILMSPPCQPFTRIGLKGDIVDPRTKSFLYILQLLPRLSRLPRYILLENVKGFEVSVARERLVETLSTCGYIFHELMISPTTVRIPNSRLRYFLIAHISPENDRDDLKKKISDAFPVPTETTHQEQQGPGVQAHPAPATPVLYKVETPADVQRKQCQNRNVSIRQIQEFLEPSAQINLSDFLLEPKTLLRYSLILDIVTPTCRRSICFTKGYRRYVEGTGSVLQSSPEAQLEDVFKHLEHLCDDEDKLKQLQKLQLRYFTPREVANLMGFPKSFIFPQHTSIKQQYKVLGNSLNVTVVTRLLQLLVQ